MIGTNWATPAACREDQPRVKPRVDDGRLDASEDAVDRQADTPLWLQLRLLIKRQIKKATCETIDEAAKQVESAR